MPSTCPYIKNYSKYLVANAAPAIMRWIIEGAQKAITDNYRLKTPKCVKDAIDRYSHPNPPLKTCLMIMLLQEKDLDNTHQLF